MQEKRFWSLKVPPPIQVLAAILIMYLISRLIPSGNILPSIGWLGTLLIVAGLALNIFAGVVFGRAKTQISPLDPSKTTSLVQEWPYSMSRNPIYVAMTILLVGVVILFGNVFNVLVVIGFVWFITEFQIKPEEGALTEIFGDDYADYMRRVRRWI